MTAEKKGVKVTIAEREFTIACGDGEAQGVIEAASYLDKQMRLISTNNQALGADRCAIMAALNISHDLLQARKNLGDDSQAARIDKLYTQVDGAIEGFRQVAI